MAGHTDLTKDVDIDIAGLFANIWKKKWLIACVSLLAGVITFMVMSSIAPRYETTAQLIIEPRESRFTQVNEQDRSSNSSEFDTAAVLSQVQIILSDSIALRTIKKLDLASSKEFSRNEEPSLVKDIMVLIGLQESEPVLSPDEQKSRNDERVLKVFKDRLKAYSIENSRVIEVYFWANDRNLAKTVTNEVAEQYLQLQQESKLQTDASATEFLEPEIARLRDKVRKAEARVAEYRSSSDILLGNNNSLLATQQLSEVSTELSRVRAQRSAAQAKIKTIRTTINSGGSLEMVPEVIASALIQRLRERQVQLRAQISELSVTLLPSHPRLKSLRSQLNDFENQIRKEARAILKSLENNLDILKSQETSLVAELTRLKAESARAGEAEVELRALERDAVSERELLQSYMTKFREAAGRQTNKYIPVNARIISSAHTPTEPFFPKTVPYTIVVAIMAAVLAMVGVLMTSLMTGSALKTVNTGAGANYPHREAEPAMAERAFSEQSAQQPINRDLAAVEHSAERKVTTPVIAVEEVTAQMEKDLVAAEQGEQTSSPSQSHDPLADNLNIAVDRQMLEAEHLAKDEQISDEGNRRSADEMVEAIFQSDNAQKSDLEEEVRQAAEERFNAEFGAVDAVANQQQLSKNQIANSEVRSTQPPSIQYSEAEDKFRREAQEESAIDPINLDLVTAGLLRMGKTRIAVVSPGGDEGSAVTWLLAQKLAENSSKTIVLDMTGSGVTTEYMLGTSNVSGAGDFLSGTVELNEIIRQDRNSTVHIIGAGEFTSQDASQIRDRLTALIDTLADLYDYVIIDCGYVDAHGLAQVADVETVVLVSAVGSAKAKQIEQELLEIGYPEAVSVQPTIQETRDVMALVA